MSAFPGCDDAPSDFISFSLLMMYARSLADGVVARGNYMF